jgi:hypothetical protein
MLKIEAPVREILSSWSERDVAKAKGAEGILGQQ